MNISLRKLLAGLLIFSVLSASSFAQGRIATIDLNKAFSNYWKRKEAEANLKDLQGDLEKELKSMVSEVTKAKEAYQKLKIDANDQAASTEEREKRNKLAEDKLKQIRDLEDSATQFDRQAKTQLDERSRSVRDAILKEIKNVVSAKAKAGGFALVLDGAAETRNFTPVVLYNNNEFDITDAVLEQLNLTAPAGKSDTKSDPKSDDKKKDQKKDAKK
jgi:outer membrane protein